MRSFTKGLKLDCLFKFLMVPKLMKIIVMFDIQPQTIEQLLLQTIVLLNHWSVSHWQLWAFAFAFLSSWAWIFPFSSFVWPFLSQSHHFIMVQSLFEDYFKFWLSFGQQIASAQQSIFGERGWFDPSQKTPLLDHAPLLPQQLVPKVLA